MDNISALNKPNIRATAVFIVSVVLFVVLLFYYPFVYLNFVFNFGNLPPANIPYFLDSQVWPWSWFYLSSRYGVFWWILFTDAGMLLVLMLVFVVFSQEQKRENTYLKSVLLNPTGGPTEKTNKMKTDTAFRWALLLLCGVGTIIQFLKCVYFIFGGLTCNQVQQCRAFNLAKGQTSVVPNLSYWWLMVSQVLYGVILFAYLCIFLPPAADQLIVKPKGQ